MTETQSELNQILYGPPGTGKTYATIEAALKIVAPDEIKKTQGMSSEERRQLKKRFDDFVKKGRIRFVTFHQSFSYEDFVEGIRATVNADTKQTEYRIEDGVFKALCKVAARKANTGTGLNQPLPTLDQPLPALDLPLPAFDGRPLTEIRKNPQIWKISLGAAGENPVQIHCLNHGEARIGWAAVGDLTGLSSEKLDERLKQHKTKVGGSRTIKYFCQEIKQGDILVCISSLTQFSAVGLVVGDYYFDKLKADFNGSIFHHMRSVVWVYRNLELPIGPLNKNRDFAQRTISKIKRFNWVELRKYLIDNNVLPVYPSSQSTSNQPHIMVIDDHDGGTVYEIDPEIWKNLPANLKEAAAPNTPSVLVIDETVQNEVDGITHGRVFELDRRVWNTLKAHWQGENRQPNNAPAHVPQAEALNPPTQTQPYVLIIDEINRGNVSRIFGELITLIEPDKRDGQPEALSVCLPYSKETFSVPNNVYLIGTMNTADRSLAGLDIALRRRFSFVEMPPRPELLKGINVEGVNIGELLQVMNERIELLLDRDHCLGHAYFMPLITTPSLPVLPVLGSIFRNKIIPLLQEYFFEDWQRIHWVLNDHRKPNAEHQFVQQPAPQDKLFGEGVNVNEQNRRWTINDAAFGKAEAYQGIIGVNGLPDVSQTGENGAAPQ